MKLKYMVLLLVVACNPFDKSGKDSDPAFCAHNPHICESNNKPTPKIKNIMPPADGKYVAGNSLSFEIKMDHPIDIIGNVFLNLQIGRYSKKASCTKLQSDTLKCDYTLSDAAPQPDLTFDGIELIDFDTTSGQVVSDKGVAADLSTTNLHLQNIAVYYSAFQNWLDATDQSTIFSDPACTTPIINNTDAACWVDKRSGQAFTNSTANNRPLYLEAGGPNTSPTLYFNDDFLDSSSLVTIQPQFTLFIVYDVVTFNSLNYFIGSMNNTTPGIGFGFGGSWAGGPAGNGLFIITKASAGSASNTLVSTLEPSSWGLATYMPQNIYYNQVEALPYAAAEPLALPLTFKRIGRREDANSCCKHDGHISEIMIFGQSLGDEQRQEVWCYLYNKYGFNYGGC